MLTTRPPRPNTTSILVTTKIMEYNSQNSIAQSLIISITVLLQRALLTTTLELFV